MAIDNELINEWKELADSDLKTAKLLISHKDFLHGIFHLQQAIEKYLNRYYIINKQEQPPYIHNLSEIAKQADLFIALSEEHKDLLEGLTPYYIKARYPTYKKKMAITLDQKRATEIQKTAEEFILWLENLKK
ncbi:MAG: HEPN domain-containing protein [Oligoflexia bacterium]|nr:HEPN domain-containing protein [Oligoflexia bacterium]